MSSVIDSRIVQLAFDNKNFESNAQTSIGTLDKLKGSLNFDGMAKGLESIGTGVKNVGFGALGDAVDTVKSRFSAMEVIAITALANITNSVVNTGKQMLNSLTVEPIREGFGEYELKLGSVQTIMASTGADLKTVNAKLAELNTYADKTIYSFSDMTSSIGKFTNAGVKLDDAVAAIQGVSNVAAVSGANAQEASRAMYNFAQALSAGYVKLIDWKSIENANMATVEFKTQLLEAAVAAGTVEKTADGMYKVLSTNIKGDTMDDLIDATKNFNDSLSYQWMTTEVLTKTLGKYADETTDIGKKSFAAAQDVKSFTQLMDTLKEAVGSGWAESFEIIIGDFDEAKKVWTAVSKVVGGFIDNVSKARNEVLNTWDKMGGRTVLLKGISVTFTQLTRILGIAKKAFENVFPPKTDRDLSNLIHGFEKLYSNFKVTGDTAGKLHNIFKGVFSIFHIGATAVEALYNGFMRIVKAFTSRTGTILNTGNSFADFAIRLDELVTRTDIFNRIINTTIDIIFKLMRVVNGLFTSLTGMTIPEFFVAFPQMIIDLYHSFKDTDIVKVIWSFAKSVKDGIMSIDTSFSGFKKIDTSGLSELSETTKSRLEPLKKIFDGIKLVFSKLADFFGYIKPILSKLLGIVGEDIKKFGKALKDSFASGDFSIVKNIVSTGLLGMVAKAIKDFMDSLTGFTKSSSGTIKGIKGIFSSVRESLEEFQKSLQAKTLMTIASAIGIITLSLIGLTLIDQDKLADAILALSMELTGLITAFKLLSKIDYKGAAKQSVVLISIASALVIMSGAVAILAQLEPKQLALGVSSVILLTAALVKAIQELSSRSTVEMTKGISGVIAFAIALRMMVKPVKDLGEMNPKELGLGLSALALMIFGLVKATQAMSSKSTVQMTKGVGGIIAFAVALRLLVKPVKDLGEMDPKELGLGLSALALMLYGMVAVVNGMPDQKKLIGIGLGLIALAGAVNLLVNPVKELGGLDAKQLGIGLSALALILYGLSAFTNTMPDSAKMLAVGAGLLVVSGAIAVIAAVIKNLGEQPIDVILVGVASLASALLMLSLALLAMNENVKGAVALTLAATGLAILAPALFLMSKMGKGAIVALLELAGALTIMGVAALLLEPLIVPLLAISAAMVLIGTGMLAFGAGVTMVSTGLATLSLSLVAFAKAIPVVFESLGNILSGIINGLVAIVHSFLDALTVLVPDIIELLATIIESLGDNSDKIIGGLLEIFVTLLEKLVEYFPRIIDVVLTFLLELEDALINKIPEFAQKGFDMLIAFIDGLSDAIEKNRDRLKASILNFCGVIIETIMDFFGIHSPSKKLAEVGKNLILGLIQGLADNVAKAVTKIKDVMKNVLDSTKETIEKFVGKGKEVVTNIQNGIDKVKDKVKDAVVGALSLAVDAVKKKIEDFKDAGENVVNGLKEGISGTADKVKNGAKNMAKGAIDTVTGLFEVRSPSRKFMKIGQYVSEGLALGITNYTDKVEEASETVGKTALDTVKDVLNNIGKDVEGNIDLQPTIAPVLDLDNVRTGMSALDSMLYTNRSIALASNLDLSAGYSVDNNTQAITESLSKEFRSLRGDVADLAESITRMKIVMDRGTVVGELIGDIDVALGNRAILAGRSV